jgi:hypothetical protein
MRRHLPISLLLTVLLTVPGVPHTAQSAGPAGPDQSLTMVTPDGAEPDIDVSPSNANRLVMSAQTQNTRSIPSYGAYPVWFSSNGGRSWQQANGAGPFTYGDPNIAFDGSGSAYLVVTSIVSPYRVYVAKSTDGGATFPNLVQAIDSTTTFMLADGTPVEGCTSSFFDRTVIGADRSTTPRVYVSAFPSTMDKFRDGICDNGAFHLFISSTDGGQPWGNGWVFTETPQAYTKITVASNGTVMLSETNGVCPSLRGIVFRKSTDHGQTFFGPSCVLDGGAGWVGSWAEVAVHPTDPNLVWISFNQVEATPTNSTHVFVMRSQDGGSNWTAPVRVDEVLPDDVVDHYKPSLSVSSTGRLDIAWFDYRNSSPKLAQSNGQPGDIYYSYSLDGGTTWAQSLRLSSATAPALYSRYNDFLTVTSSGKKAYVAFSVDGDLDGRTEAYISTLTFK